MAGDWIKVEHTTPDKPEVIRMATALKIDQDAVVGKLFRVWAWADQNSVDGNTISVTDAFLDRLTGKRGFADAMRSAGWLCGDDGALTFPNFDRHNGKTAKARGETNRRVAKHRFGRSRTDSPTDGNGNGFCVTDALQKPLPEKRREEKRTIPNPKSPPEVHGSANGKAGDWRAWNRAKATDANAVPVSLLAPAEFRDAWQRWRDYRTRRAVEARISSEAIVWTEDAATAGMRECERFAETHGWEAVIAQIDAAIAGTWQGLNFRLVQQQQGRRAKHEAYTPKRATDGLTRDQILKF